MIEAAAALEPPVIGAMVFVEPARLERLAAEQPAWKDGGGAGRPAAVRNYLTNNGIAGRFRPAFASDIVGLGSV